MSTDAERVTHLLGPWFGPCFSDGKFYIAGPEIEKGKRFLVARTTSATPLDEANGRLIAAAPDMLALLRELIDIEGPQPGTAEWARKVQATLAKAEGRDV